MARCFAVAISQAAGFWGNARLRPLFERGNKGVLREFFRNAHVAHDSSQPGNHPSRLDFPNRFDGTMCFGSPHSYPSHHAHAVKATSARSALAQFVSAPAS